MLTSLQRKTLPLAAALIGASTVAVAQDIDETLVVGQALEETIPLALSRYGSRLEIVDAGDIELGGYSDLSQTIQMEVPGFHLSPKNGAFDYFDCSMQGSRCQDILWLVDGVRINNRLYNTTTPLDTIPAHMVERVEVLYGGQGIFYGTQSVAGVVNVVTKGFSQETRGNLSVGLNSNDGLRQALDFSTSIDDLMLTFYASNDEADGFQPYPDSQMQPSATDRERGYEVTTAGIKLAWQPSDVTAVQTHFHRTDAALEFARPNLNALTENQRDEDLLTVKIDHQFSDQITAFVKAYYHNWDTNYWRVFNNLDGAGALDGTQTVRNAGEYWGYDDSGITGVLSWQSDLGLDVSAGFEQQNFSGSDEVLLIADEEEQVNAYFAQLATADQLFENTRLALGVRQNNPEGEGDISVWNFSGMHNFADTGWYARVNAGTSFRLPDAWQLYGNDPCCTLGNPDLQGEKSQNTNLAFGRQVNSDTRFELVVFERTVDNLIGSEPAGTPGRKRINLDQEVNFEGLQFSAQTLLYDAFSLAVDYTHTSAEAQGSNQQVEGIPRSLLKASLSSTEGARIEWKLGLVYTGELYDSALSREDIGGYSVVDLGVGYRFGPADQHRVGLRLENLLDEEYTTALGSANRDVGGASYQYTALGTPRTAHLTYSYQF